MSMIKELTRCLSAKLNMEWKIQNSFWSTSHHSAMMNFIFLRFMLQLSMVVLAISLQFFHFVHGDVGTSAQYNPPYLPTECYGNDESQFPSSNLFAAAGEAIWDNGASCGRQYLVRCISAAEDGTCALKETIQIKIVDYAITSASRPSFSGTTMLLSETAFAAIANSSVDSINIEFQQV